MFLEEQTKRRRCRGLQRNCVQSTRTKEQGKREKDKDGDQQGQTAFAAPETAAPARIARPLSPFAFPLRLCMAIKTPGGRFPKPCPIERSRIELPGPLSSSFLASTGNFPGTPSSLNREAAQRLGSLPIFAPEFPSILGRWMMAIKFANSA